MAEVINQEVWDHEAKVTPAEKPKRGPFTVRNFRLLWSGETISLLGDQFYMLALSWLIIQLTGSGIAVGTILMAGGVPRVLFMLIGGAMTDRLSPRTLMISSNAVRGILTLILTLLVLTSTVQLWMLYVLAVAFGTADAFFHPAYMAIVPAIVEPEQLEASNAIVQGSGLITQAVGPGLAGLLVSIPVVGTALAFALDALSFFFTTGTLSLMHGSNVSTKPKSEAHGNILNDIVEGFRAVGRDPVLPPLLIIIAAINFLFTGPMSVGPAKLAQVRFVEGALALGWIGSAFGIGALVGMVLGGTVKPKKFGLLSMVVIGISGICLAALGLAQQLLVATLASAVMGATVGFVNVLYITWMQRRVASELMGRIMSMVMLASLGLGPISNALAGLLVEINVTGMFVGAGALLILTVAASALNPQVRNVQN
jgi:MFS family permease